MLGKIAVTTSSLSPFQLLVEGLMKYVDIKRVLVNEKNGLRLMARYKNWYFRCIYS